MIELFNTISKMGSPSDKIRALLSHPQQEELKTVLRLATDPFLTFGITSTDGESKGNADTYHVLGQLARRELTGSAARLALGEATLDGEDRELVHRIIRKDLRCGVGEKLVLQAYPGLIRQFEVMRADKFKGLPSRGTYFIEPKYDGLRCVSVIEGESVTLFSRNGKEFTSSDHLKEQLLRAARGLGDCVFDGELTSGNFNESSSAVRRKSCQNDQTVYNVFDYLPMEEWKNPLNHYISRRRSLENLFQVLSEPNLILVPSFRVSSEEEVFKRYGQFLDMGYEGGIIKRGEGIYRFKRHRDWMKLKEVNDVDLKVESLVQGEGKYYGMLGAVIVRYKGKRVNVGSGFSDTERQMFWDDPTLIQHKVIEIQYHQETPDGSLRHPRFVKVREDKS